ncbi:hypothetical protein GCM10009678_44470 [Actinomadura kijaniata]|uniref:Uncharacterized protein n=1 Tax=Actinomadura namibiensis TaxID=182080 RepID=A0A7W3QMS3_ACTNM|nr:hypothetical protein [Actinomadura namibiensis]MBA8952855.1 hypothetical protein [Actinomadura namibiensis]
MRNLPEDVADVLDLLLDGDGPAHRELRGQLPHLGVRERCGCGCGTAYFELDTDAVPPASVPGRGTVIAAEAQIVTGGEEWLGEVLLFVQGGYLSWLEVCSYGLTEMTLAEARPLLRPYPASTPGTDPGT